MTNRDYVDTSRPANLLENYGIPSNPAERKAYEAEKKREFQAQNREASAQAPQALQQYEQNLGAGTERVFLVNNKARPIHIPDEQIVIDGQLAVSAKGPFLQISKEKLDSSYMLQTFMEKPLSKTNPHLRGVMSVERITEDEYKRRYREYLNRKAIRDAEYAKEHNAVARHEDGTIDEEDASFEVRKINPRIVRAQG